MKTQLCTVFLPYVLTCAKGSPNVLHTKYVSDWFRSGNVE